MSVADLLSALTRCHRAALAVLACALLAPPLSAQAASVDLIDDAAQWITSVDGGITTMALAATDGTLGVTVRPDGGQEDYPRIRRIYPQQRDWRGFGRIRSRMRVVCDDPAVTSKLIAFVFYDEETRHPDLPGNPMKQQIIPHALPVNRWVDLSDWLVAISRRSISGVDLYMYEVPPSSAHEYRWEIAQLELEGVGEEGAVFDTQVYDRDELHGALGEPVGRVRSGDGLRITVGGSGEITRLALDGEACGRGAADCPTGLLVRDVAAGGAPTMVGGVISDGNDEIRQTATLPELGLELNATYKGRGPYIEVAGLVSDTRGQDRAVTVYLALPLARGEWQWWDSVAAARTEAGPGAELSYLERGMAYGLEGSHSKYPLGAVTLPDRSGLSLAIRMDEPAVHRIGYSPKLQLFYIAVDLGLVPERRVDGRPLSEAPFRFLVSRHDPTWGFRDALQRYYTTLPEFFTTRVPHEKEGGWYVWGDMSETPGALEAGFGLHWGVTDADAVKWDNANGPLALLYIEPQTYQQSMEDFDRQPTVDEVMGRLERLASGDEAELALVETQPYRVYPLGLARDQAAIHETCRAVRASLCVDETGLPFRRVAQLPWMAKSQWGAMMTCNLAPGIPSGKGQFNREVIIEPALLEMERAGGHYDGIALDSFGLQSIPGFFDGRSSGANYQREHFKYADFPLSFAARTHEPVLVTGFATVEWLRDLARDMHGRGMVLMANCSWGSTPGWLTFAAPYLDIFGAESTQFADPDFIRAIARRKPCTDMPYAPRPEWEVPWHWLHGIYPGKGNDLAIMERHDALLHEISAAGWEPITGARVSPDLVRAERYGSGEDTHIVLHNTAGEAVTATVRLDAAAINTRETHYTVLPADQTVEANEGTLSVQLDARETVVVVPGRP